MTVANNGIDVERGSIDPHLSLDKLNTITTPFERSDNSTFVLLDVLAPLVSCTTVVEATPLLLK